MTNENNNQFERSNHMEFRLDMLIGKLAVLGAFTGLAAIAAKYNSPGLTGLAIGAGGVSWYAANRYTDRTIARLNEPNDTDSTMQQGPDNQF